MNITEIFSKLEQDYPKRQPGSPGAAAVIKAIEEQTASWGFTAETQKIPVYSMQTGIWVYIIGSIFSIAAGYFNPVAGLILAGLFWLLLLKEPFRPTLAKLKPGQAENIQLTIPARSKESQKIILLANFSTDNFSEHPPKQNSRVFIGLVLGSGLISVLLLLFRLLLQSGPFTSLALIPILIIAALNLLAKDSAKSEALSNCSILLEIGAILAKAGVSTTSVTFCFTGANALNSGIYDLPKRLKGAPELKYIVNLVDWADKRINLVTTDGLLLPLPSDPFLVESLMEVAREKGIPLQAVKLSEISSTYSLKLKKLKAVSVTNPLEPAESSKNLRELLIGFIRKLDS